MVSIIGYLYEGKFLDTLDKAKQGYLKFEDRLGKEAVGATKDMVNSVKTVPSKFSNFVNDMRGINYKIKK